MIHLEKSNEESKKARIFIFDFSYEKRMQYLINIINA